MGRELRRVPVGWEHPRKRVVRDQRRTSRYVPLFPPEDRDADAMNEMDIEPECYADYPPFDGSQDYGYCVYETVSEGTPVSPVFRCPEDLVTYLMEHGDYADQEYEGRKGLFGLSDPMYGPWDRESAEALVLRSARSVSGVIHGDGTLGTRKETFGNQIKGQDCDEG